jgi:hypothetical protein
MRMQLSQQVGALMTRLYWTVPFDDILIMRFRRCQVCAQAADRMECGPIRITKPSPWRCASSASITTRPGSARISSSRSRSGNASGRGAEGVYYLMVVGVNSHNCACVVSNGGKHDTVRCFGSELVMGLVWWGIRYWN